MEKVIIYGRVSEMGPNFSEKISYESQVNEIKKYCERKNYEIVESFKDLNYSGGNDKRPDFQLMFSYLRKHHKEISAVVVYNLSRFSRNLMNLKIYLEELDKLDIDFLSVMEPFCELKGSARGFMINILGAVAELQREQNIEVVRSAMMLKSSLGKHLGGKIPFGYEKDLTTGKYKIVEEDAQIVRYVFNRYLEGGSATQIAKEISSAQAVKGLQFNEGTILNMLSNEKYTGMYIFGKTRNKKDGSGKVKLDREKWKQNPNNHDAIIEQELFESVQQERFSRRRVKKADNSNLKGTKLLTGLVKCSFCNSHYYVSSSTKPNGTQYYYYMCSNKECIQKKIRKVQLENTVLAAIENVIDLETLIKFYQVEYQLVIDRIKIILEQEYHLKRKINDLKKEKDIYLDVIKEERKSEEIILTPDYKERVKGINARISNLQQQVAENNIKFKIKQLPKFEDIVEQFDEQDCSLSFLKTFTLDTVRRIIRHYVEDIIIIDAKGANETMIRVDFKNGVASKEFTIKRGERNLPEELSFSSQDDDFESLILITNVLNDMKDLEIAN
ncbi:MAG: recombinase family protein [Bacillota bacterium]|nr:recombinase family protein [Bacillota bacterium]